jgi:hypothetical protein
MLYKISAIGALYPGEHFRVEDEAIIFQNEAVTPPAACQLAAAEGAVADAFALARSERGVKVDSLRAAAVERLGELLANSGLLDYEAAVALVLPVTMEAEGHWLRGQVTEEFALTLAGVLAQACGPEGDERKAKKRRG